MVPRVSMVNESEAFVDSAIEQANIPKGYGAVLGNRFFGGSGEIRTLNQWLKRPLLYH